jgi:dynein heavy chain
MQCCALLQVLSITLSSIQTCEDFKGQFMKYDYLWKQDLNQALQVRTD